MGDRFYRQKCEFFKISGAELIYIERNPDSKEAKALERKAERKVGVLKGTSTKRVLKADVLAQLIKTIGVSTYTCDGLEKLTVVDLQKLDDAIASPYGFVSQPSPKKGLKKVYVDYLKEQVSQEVDFNKATLKALKGLIEALGY